MGLSTSVDSENRVFFFFGRGLMCKLVSVLCGSPIIYSAARRSRRATRICLILNYTLVYITWQSVHINLIGF